jgi:hypothetical protein
VERAAEAALERSEGSRSVVCAFAIEGRGRTERCCKHIRPVLGALRQHDTTKRLHLRSLCPRRGLASCLRREAASTHCTPTSREDAGCPDGGGAHPRPSAVLRSFLDNAMVTDWASRSERKRENHRDKMTSNPLGTLLDSPPGGAWRAPVKVKSPPAPKAHSKVAAAVVSVKVVRAAERPHTDSSAPGNSAAQRTVGLRRWCWRKSSR